MHSAIKVVYLHSCASNSGRIGLKTAEVIQKKIFVSLGDYRGKDEKMHEQAVPISAKRASEQYE
jgi:hypothetical protein